MQAYYRPGQMEWSFPEKENGPEGSAITRKTVEPFSFFWQSQ